MRHFQFGQIVDAYITDARRQVKERPALIVSHDDDNDAGLDLFVIAITGGVEEPCPNYHFVVHDSLRRDARTGLDKPSVAKCNWFRTVKQSKVLNSRGYLDDDLLEVVVNRFLELHQDPTFDNWVGPAPDLTRDQEPGR